jgi:hypothetical protein
MRKEYVVVRIDSAPDGSPYVLVSFADPRDMKEGRQKTIPHVMGFSSMDDLMKNIQKAFSSASHQIMGGNLTTIRMDMREYEDSELKVGDKVYIDINKVALEGV